MATSTFTIYLLKTGLASIHDAIDPEKPTTEHLLTGLDGTTGSLFLGQQKNHTPDWVDMVRPFLDTSLPGVVSASRSAVLIANHGGRSFAFVFGHGKSLLKAASWERGFGLKVTLNRVDPDALRSIDSKTYEDLVVSTRKQTSKTSSLGSFELDVGRALVRGVAGNAGSSQVFTRFAGSDALRVTTTLSFSDLPQLLTQIKAAYAATDYRANFAWIDNIREADPTKVPVLDQKLVQALQGGGGSAYLAPADVVDWEDIEDFNFTGGNQGDAAEDLSLVTYLAIVTRRNQTVNLDSLKRHEVRVRYVNDSDFRKEWSVYDCLVWETQHQNKRYTLFDGRWFEVSPSYAAKVDGFVTRITGTANLIPFPDANASESEGAYNKRVAASNAGLYAMLDCVTFRPSGGSTPIEFCDLMTSGSKIVHVKKRSSSATLSHLFSQGSVSADLFLNDKSLRTSVRKKLTQLKKANHASLIPVPRPNPADYQIVYAVIAAPTRGTFPPRLPFFSAVNLMHHGSRIEGLGFQLSLQYIRQR